MKKKQVGTFFRRRLSFSRRVAERAKRKAYEMLDCFTGWNNGNIKETRPGKVSQRWRLECPLITRSGASVSHKRSSPTILSSAVKNYPLVRSSPLGEVVLNALLNTEVAKGGIPCFRDEKSRYGLRYMQIPW